MTDRIQATPRKRPGLGVLADALGAVDDFTQKPFGYPNPPVSMLSELLGVPAMRRTLERLTYGEPLTTGAGQATRIRPDTDEAAMSALGPLGKLAAVTKGLPVGASIKAKGGNWIQGNVKEALSELQSPRVYAETYRNFLQGPDGADFARWTNAMRDKDPQFYTKANQNSNGAWDMMQQYLAESGKPPVTLSTSTPDGAINTWLDQKLAKYVQNEMGTPEDPVRALAERGVLHVPPEDLAQHMISKSRVARKTDERNGRPLRNPQLGQSETAKAWEDVTDSSVLSNPASTWDAKSELVKSNPWLQKVDPDTPVWAMTAGPNELGFTHLRDELRNAINPASGLPANLLLKPEALSRVTVPQAVERVALINAWRAAQKAEADMVRANNAATAVHKEYPDKGFKWVELKAPEGTNPAYLGNGKYEDEVANLLQDALKYEGETMGHCVGGYCPDVLEGRSRIFSLRDAKGQPHVTIEVAPSNATPYDTWYNTADPTEQESFKQWLQEVKPDSKGGLAKWYEDWVKETGRTPAQPRSSIVQIKGKGNAKPKDDYLPFVQDFVRSGKWSDVGDYGNTGFLNNMRGGDRLRLGSGYIDLPDQHFTAQELMDLVRGHDSVKGLDPKEVEGFLRGQLQNQYLPPDTGFAEGGSVDLNSLTQKYSAQLRDYITARKRRENDDGTTEEKPRAAQGLR